MALNFFNKNMAIFILFVPFFFSLTLLASTRIGPEKRESIDLSAFVILEGTEVENMTHIEGTLVGQKVTLNRVTVEGSAQFKNSTIRGQTRVNGAFRFGQGKTVELAIKGGAEISDAFVQGSSSIDGALSALNTSFLANLDVRGVAKLGKSHVKGKMIVDGSVFARSSIFDQQVFLDSNQSVFEDCKFSYISVRKGRDNRSSQHLVLRGSTVVTEDIIFEKSGFLVLVGDQVKIQGKVENAKIITQAESRLIK